MTRDEAVARLALEKAKAAIVLGQDVAHGVRSTSAAMLEEVLRRIDAGDVAGARMVAAQTWAAMTAEPLPPDVAS